MDKFIEKYKLLKLTQQEKDLNISIKSKEIEELVSKNFPQRKAQD